MRESIIALAKAGYNTQQINAILGSGTMANDHTHNMSDAFNGGVNEQLPASLAPQQASAAPMATPSQSVIDYIQMLNRNNTSFDLPPNTVTADSVLDNMLNESIGYNTLPDTQKGVTNNG